MHMILHKLDNIREAQFREAEMLRRLAAQLKALAEQQAALADKLDSLNSKRSEQGLGGLLQELFGTDRAPTVKLIVVVLAIAYMVKTGQADKVASMILGM